MAPAAKAPTVTTESSIHVLSETEKTGVPVTGPVLSIPRYSERVAMFPTSSYTVSVIVYRPSEKSPGAHDQRYKRVPGPSEGGFPFPGTSEMTALFKFASDAFQWKTIVPLSAMSNQARLAIDEPSPISAPSTVKTKDEGAVLSTSNVDVVTTISELPSVG